MENNIFDDFDITAIDITDPIKKQLLELLMKVKSTEVQIKRVLAKGVKNVSVQEESYKSSPLSLFVHDEEQLVSFIHRLRMCKTSKEWALHAVYPLYENGDITAEVAKSKHFIELTIPYCENMSTKNYNTLAKQLRTHCYFPR